jgi:predicted HicB family RNase H-like nuclease
MINQMTIDGVKAVITYDSEIEMFRGEFLGLNGGADFYAQDAEGLRREGAISLQVFLDACNYLHVIILRL